MGNGHSTINKENEQRKNGGEIMQQQDREQNRGSMRKEDKDEESMTRIEGNDTD